MISDKRQPLADRIRPRNFDDIVGQGHLFGKNGAITTCLDGGYLPNMIFYGPPGTGKTTSARIIAEMSGMTLRHINATTASTSDIKDVIGETDTILVSNGILLYHDEIQYFNKKQQQTLLEYIEDGRITLIASTTENPYLYVYNAIISRSAVFEFKAVERDDLIPAVNRAFEALAAETGRNKTIAEGTAEFIADCAAGDVRRAINLTESSFFAADDTVTPDDTRKFVPSVIGNFDKAGTVHYDLLSCLQKSIRGSDPDAAVFYLAKLLEGGDIIGACRRLQVIACEDIGLAYPQAASVVHSCVLMARDLGMPEASIPLSEAAVFLATLPKSNSSHVAYEKAREDISRGKGQNIPPYLRPGNRFDGYKYPHDYENSYIRQQYLPDDLKNARYYEYGNNKTEQSAKAYWDKIKGSK